MGKTDLGKWMITNGGEYDADATYEQLTMVKYGNSTYITLKTVTGITPTDDKINYQLMAQGFDATALSAVQAEDTQGLCGEKGEIVTAQSLVDALADKVINTVMAKIGTAELTGGMTDLSSGVNSLYSNLESQVIQYTAGDDVTIDASRTSIVKSGNVVIATIVFTPKYTKNRIDIARLNGELKINISFGIIEAYNDDTFVGHCVSNLSKNQIMAYPSLTKGVVYRVSITFLLL